MVTRTKARILGSFQTRKLTGNKGNVRCNGMEKDGLVARGPRALGTRCGFLQLKAGHLRISFYCVVSPQPSDLIWYHSLFSIPKVSEGFLSFFFLLKHMSLLMIICKINKSHWESKGVPEGQILALIQCDGLETFSRCFVVCCRRFMVQECFNRNMEAMPWS